MKNIGDLKTDIMDGKLSTFYVFYGEDTGLRKHYIDKLSTFYDTKYMLDSYEEVRHLATANDIFSRTKLFVVVNDEAFSKLSSTQIQQFIGLLGNKDYCCVFIYDGNGLESTNLFKDFGDYCTEFSVVVDKIAIEFIRGEITGLTVDSEEELAYNCSNLYSNILLETDKLKNYQCKQNSTPQSSYEALKVKNQLIHRDRRFDCNTFMNKVLLEQYRNIYECCNLNSSDECCKSFFGCLTFMFNDFLIAGLCRQFGSKGKGKAYIYGLPYGRAITICGFDLQRTPDYYYECARRVATLDSNIKSGYVNVNDIIETFLKIVV